MLKLRILSAAVALPLFLAAMFLLPNVWWGIALLGPLMVAGREWARLAAFGRGTEAGFLAVLAAACLLILLNVAEGAHPIQAMAFPNRAIFAVSIAFWCVVAPCWLWLKLRVRNHAALIVAGLVVLLPVWLALMRLQSNPKLLLQLLAVIWIADCAAYFVGRSLGRRKLAPLISPGKSWEGVGGAFAAVAVYAWVLQLSLPSTAGLPFVIAAFFGVTTLGIIGDLLESWLKRGAGVKDSGAVMPGHGGILDRIDSMTAALPLAALIFI